MTLNSHVNDLPKFNGNYLGVKKFVTENVTFTTDKITHFLNIL